MSNVIFLKGQNNMIELKETPYESEDIFQALIEQYPAILDGSQINPDDPCRWILISRELGVPCEAGGCDRWFLDHLFIDQNSIPTFVEVKRSNDTRIRREVVGQMLDYAANATEYWNVADIRQIYEATGHRLEDDFEFDCERVDEFWTNVSNNLKLGKVRLLFVADTIPKTLLRIIEFLNNQTINTEILGVEIKQYCSDDKQIFVPKIVGQTIQSNDVKKPERKEKQWNYESFLDDVELKGGKELKNLAIKLMKDCSEIGCRIRFGKGYAHSSIVLVYDHQNSSTQFLSLWTWTKSVYCEIRFENFKTPFNTIESRKPLKNKFEEALQDTIPDGKLNGRQSFKFEILLDEQKYQQFLQVIKSMIEDIKIFDA